MAFAAANNVRLFGRYTLLGKLGAGGHGEVWRARDHEQGNEIALKILGAEVARTPGAWAALQREFDIVSRLDHPLILKVYQPERDGAVLALPMELAPGGDLRRLRTVSYLEIGPVLLEVAQALAHTHERGIVHRDLKPGNVLFDARGHVRLADFGVAGTVLGSAAVPAGQPRTGLSPFTASPEQLRGEPPAITDDIYGLGALAYELLSGYPPYYPRFELRRAVEDPVPPLKPSHQAPERLIALVMAMLSKRADQRPASMREVIDGLDATLNDTLAFDEAAEPAEAESGSAGSAAPELAQKAPPETPRAELAEPRLANPEAAGLRPVEPRLAGTGSAEAGRAGAGRAGAGPAEAAAAEGPAAAGPAGPGTGAPIPPPRRAERFAPPADAGSTSAVGSPPSAMGARSAAASLPPRDQDLRGVWADIKVERMPSPARRDQERRARWPWVLIAGLAAAAAVSFFWLPRWAPWLESWQRLVPPGVAQPVKRIVDASQRALMPAAPRPGEQPRAAQSQPPAPSVATQDNVESARARNEARLAALDARGAGVWGGQAYADAKAREAEGIGADEGGSPAMALQKFAEAEQLLGTVEQVAPEALAAQLSTGEQALKAGNGAAARQAFELAQRIDPSNSRVAEDLRRARAIDGVLPLLVDGLNAEAGRHYWRAMQDYRRTLALDPKNAKAQAGLQRASAAHDSQLYAQSVGVGLDALQDGRLQAAQEAFEQAHRVNSHGQEAEEGLARVSTAMRDRELEQLQSRGTALEAQQRWNEALQAYDAALEIDPSLAFAQEGRARVAAKAGLLSAGVAGAGSTGASAAGAGLARTDLTTRMQALVDDPQQLDSPAVRAEAGALIGEADAMRPSGAILRQLAARLSVLAREYDKTVHLSLISDNVTEVEIQQIGSFGTFVRREIDLKPGTYTVIGTRAGYKDVRRDVTIEPGKDTLTISVRCEEPI